MERWEWAGGVSGDRAGGWEVVGDQWCCGIKTKCFYFTLTVIFHVQVEVHIEFTVIFQLMVSVDS